MQYVEVIPHPLYDYEDTNNDAFDVLILKTKNSMLLPGMDVEKIELAEPEDIQNDLGVYAVGYGQTSEKDIQLSDQLRDVVLYYVKNETCAAQYTQRIFDPELMFCTGVPGGGKDTCKVRFVVVAPG